MLTITSKRHLVTVESFGLSYDYIDTPGAGFSFDCTRDGVRIPNGNDLAEANWVFANEQVKLGKMRFNGIVDYSHSYREPARGLCECGGVVILSDSLANPCERCDREYNFSGQELAPRSQWDPEDRYAVEGPRNQPDWYE